MSADETELKQLMLAGLNGNANAYRQLLDRLSRRLRAYYRSRLARVGRGLTEAEDLVQEVLLAVHTRRHTYNPDEPFTPWMQAIARYKLIDYLRRTRSSASDVPIDDAYEVASPDEQIKAESGYDLNRLMRTLPEKMRHAITAVKIDGLSVAEAAEKHGMSQSAIKVSIHRGLRAMADSISRGEKT